MIIRTLLPVLLLGLLLFFCCWANPALAQQQKITTQSPDQARTASALKKVIDITDNQTGKVLKRIVAHKADIVALRYAPDGKSIGSVDTDGNVLMFDSATGKLNWKCDCGLKGNGTLSFSPDGTKLQYSVNGMAKTIATATGKPLQ
jgi:WD40 repeat protein